MNRFALRPLANSMSVKPGDNIEEYALTPGLSRQKVMYEGAVFTVQATVSLHNVDRKKYWWSFFREWQRDPQPFLWDIETDGGEREDHICQFIVGSITESKRNGHIVAMSFQVRAEPILRNAEDDKSVIALWNNGMGETQNKVHKVPNIWFPAAIGDRDE